MIYKEVRKGNRKLVIHTDEDCQSPREWDNLGIMVCFHGRYNLGDDHDFENPDDFRQEINDGNAIILPLYLYDHSGITIATSSRMFSMADSAGWDWGQVGWIYILKEDVRREYGKKRISTRLKEKVVKVLEGEVKVYDQYLTGDVFGFQLIEIDSCDECGSENEEVIDSCWGFYGEDWDGMKWHVREEYHGLFEEL